MKVCTDHPPRRPARRAGTVGALLSCLCCQVLVASDPFEMIPADVPLVIAFRDLDGAAEKTNAWLRETDRKATALDLDEVQRGFNLPDGVVDTSAPACLILTRPAFRDTAFVLAFTPRGGTPFAEKALKRKIAISRGEGADGPYYLMMRDGVAFVGLKRKAVRLLRQVPQDQSLASVLDARQRALYASSDVFVHAPLKKWRSRISPVMYLAANAIKLGIAAEHSEALASGTSELVDWFVGGTLSFVEQMERLTLALELKDETFRLTHHHQFTRDGSVSRYLTQVKRTGRQMWTTLPDRPFTLVGMLDWQCPTDTSLAVRFRERIFTSESIMANTPVETRQRLRDATRRCFGQARGSNFMMTSAKGEILPIQIFGGWDMANAREAVRDIIFLQENSKDAMTAVMGGPFVGGFRKQKRQGIELYEMALDFSQMGPEWRRHAVTAVYGDDVLLQQGALDEHHVVYSMAQPPTGVLDLARALTSGRHVGKNRLVRKIVSRLPPEANAVFVLDLGRCLALPSRMVHVGAAALLKGRTVPAEDLAYSEPAGPMLGWACVIGADTITGQCVIDAGDVRKLPELLQRMKRDVTKRARESTTGKSTGPVDTAPTGAAGWPARAGRATANDPA